MIKILQPIGVFEFLNSPVLIIDLNFTVSVCLGKLIIYVSQCSSYLVSAGYKMIDLIGCIAHCCL